MENCCRVCMSPGAYRLFPDAVDKRPTPAANNGPIKNEDNVSSLDKLLEKLRYVTMIQINDRRNEPKMMCDMCIIQLNVAYKFKRLANKTEAETQQYIIEHGLDNSNSIVVEAPSSSPATITSDTESTAGDVIVIVEPKVEPPDSRIDATITTEATSPAALAAASTPPQPAHRVATSTKCTEDETSSGQQRHDLPPSPPPMIAMVEFNGNVYRVNDAHLDADFIGGYLPAATAGSGHAVAQRRSAPTAAIGRYFTAVGSANDFIVANSKARLKALRRARVAHGTKPRAAAAPPRRRSSTHRELDNLQISFIEEQRRDAALGRTRLRARRNSLSMSDTKRKRRRRDGLVPEMRF